MGNFISLSNCDKNECNSKEASLLISDIKCEISNCTTQILAYNYRKTQINKNKTNRIDNKTGEVKPFKAIKNKIKKLKKEILFNYIFDNITLSCKNTTVVIEVIIPIVKNNKTSNLTNKKNNKTKNFTIKSNLSQLNEKGKNLTKKKNNKKKNNTNLQESKNSLNKTSKSNRLNLTYQSRYSPNEIHLEEIMKNSIKDVLNNLMKSNLKESIVKNKKTNDLPTTSNEVFLFLNDKIKNDSKLRPENTNNNHNFNDKLEYQSELKSITKTLNTIQQHITNLEKSAVSKRNNLETSRKNQINSNNILMSNLEKTNLISENLVQFKDQFFDKFSKNFSHSINENFNLLSKNLNKINELSKNISQMQIVKNEQSKVDRLESNCNNGRFIRNIQKCMCNKGFTGEYCQNELSCKDNCTYNGVCSLGKCYCNPGFEGANCNTTIKCVNNCNNKGKCQYGKCYCDAGFAGKDCSKKLNCENNCSNNGICFREKCLCSPGWGGKNCSVLTVDFTPCYNNCNGNGACKLDKCFCYPGFRGKFCTEKIEFVCPPFIMENNNSLNQTDWAPCNNNGVCKYGMCFCFPGFKVNL